jgi:hypothetical protein
VIKRRREAPVPVTNPSGVPQQRIVVSAPMSFAGSAKRIWPMTYARSGWEQAAMTALYEPDRSGVDGDLRHLSFGPLLIPYRLIRRGQRKRTRDEGLAQNALFSAAPG